MSTDINFHKEHSRLGPELLARWKGLPLCWLDVGGTVHNRIVNDLPVIALIDAGAAEAQIALGLRKSCVQRARSSCSSARHRSAAGSCGSSASMN